MSEKIQKVKLGDVCKIQYGYPFNSKLFTEDRKGFPLVRIRDVVRGYTETYTTEKCNEAFIVNSGDILIGMDGEFNVAQWKSEPAYLNQRVCKIKPLLDIDENYILYFLPKALKVIEERTPFVTVKHLSAKVLEGIEIPLIELSEQKEIAKKLNIVTCLIEKRKKQIEKLDELVKSRFIEMFGDPLVHSSNTVQLGSLVKIGSSKRIFEKEYVSEGIPFYRTKEIVELAKGNKVSTELFISKDRYLEIKNNYGVPKAGNLLISAVGTIGVIWVVDGQKDFYYKDGNLICVDCYDKFNPIYLKFLLGKLIFSYKSKMSAGTAYSALTIVALNNMQVDLVSIELQNKFAEFVEKVEKNKSATKKSLSSLETLKKSLMQKYFG